MIKGIPKNSGLLTFFLIIGLGLLTACKKDLPPPAQEQAFKKLKGDWVLGTITLDGLDISANYSNFTLSFTDGGYKTTNAGSTSTGNQLFRSSGTWIWSNDTAIDGIILDDGKQVTIVVLSLVPTPLFTFTFTLDSQGGVANGLNGLSGDYEISLVR